jgi:hypothetical protein
MKRVFPLLAVLAFAQCGDDPLDPGLSAFISQITGGGATATLATGTPPPAGGGFPGVVISGPSTIMPGSNVDIVLHASGTTFNRVFVQIEGMGRYYQLNLPASVTNVTITVSLTPTIEVPNFTLVLGLQSSIGQNYGSIVVGVN